MGEANKTKILRGYERLIYKVSEVKTININQIIVGKEYKINYPDKKNLIGKVLYIGLDGDCEIQYRNGHKALWHWSWLEEIKSN